MMIYKGTIDCTDNPNYPEADYGEFYRCYLDGKIGGENGIYIPISSLIICIKDNSKSDNHKNVGDSWVYFDPELSTEYHELLHKIRMFDKKMKLFNKSLKFRGYLDCTNNPDYPSGKMGDYYFIETDGKIGNIDILCNKVKYHVLICINDSSSGNHSEVGENWLFYDELDFHGTSIYFDNSISYDNDYENGFNWFDGSW